MSEKMRVALVVENVGWLPSPNRIRVMIGPQEAPEEKTRCAFLVGFTKDGRLVMANNRRRGIEVPGGHRELVPGLDGPRFEDMRATALREAFEEAWILAQDIKPVGYEDLFSDGDAPADGKYPFPQSYQQFYCGIVELNGDPAGFKENEEVLRPVLLQAAEAEKVLRPTQLAFYRAARNLLFGAEGRY